MKLDKKAKNMLEEIFKKQPLILAVYLYGSRVRGYASKDSDLDMAVVVDNMGDINYDKFYLEVGKIIKGVELDLRISTPKSDPTYLFEVIGGKYLYQRSKEDRIRFETQVLKIFYDGKHIRDIYHYYLKQSFGVN